MNEWTPSRVIRPWVHRGTTDIAVAFGAGEAFAFADLLRVRQILRNLINNAGRHGRPPVTITGSMSEGRCVVTVTDRGKGIPKDAEVVCSSRTHDLDRQTANPNRLVWDST